MPQEDDAEIEIAPDAEEAVMGGVAYSSITAILNAVTTMSAEVIMQEIGKIISAGVLTDDVKREIMPYLYAAGLLSFAGREINKEALINVMSAIKVPVDEEIVDLFLKSPVKSHLIYVYAFYYLLANGKETSEQNIAKLVQSLSIKVDSQAMKEAMEYIKANM